MVQERECQTPRPIPSEPVLVPKPMQIGATDFPVVGKSTRKLSVLWPAGSLEIRLSLSAARRQGLSQKGGSVMTLMQFSPDESICASHMQNLTTELKVYIDQAPQTTLLTRDWLSGIVWDYRLAHSHTPSQF